MGYYSDVFIKTTKKGYEKIKNDLKENLGMELGEVFTKTYHDETGATYVLEERYTKWYPECDDIACVMKSLENMASDNIPYHYIRIGEEYADIEEEYNCQCFDDEGNGNDEEIEPMDVLRDVDFGFDIKT